MRKLCRIVSILFLAPWAAAQAADTDVRVIISSDVRPGVYGRVEIGSAPPPPVVYAQPVIAVRPPQPVAVQPLYLHVPPGHAKHWAKHCARYNACGVPVYFVKSAEYEPRKKVKKKDKD